MIQPDRILLEDDHILVVHKLSGELVVAGKGKMDKLPLLDFLKEEYPSLRAVHRLDFETSGVIVFAKSKQAYEAIMNTKFDQWEKVYHTLVMGIMTRRNGTIRKPLEARGKGMVEAHTDYSVLETYGNSTYVEATIYTGRHHQIRKHFAGIGHPLVLDHLYGHKKYNGTFQNEFHCKRFFLHAIKLTFPHPITGAKVTVEAPLPKQFSGILKRLRSL